MPVVVLGKSPLSFSMKTCSKARPQKHSSDLGSAGNAALYVTDIRLNSRIHFCHKSFVPLFFLAPNDAKHQQTHGHKHISASASGFFRMDTFASVSVHSPKACRRSPAFTLQDGRCMFLTICDARFHFARDAIDQTNFESGVGVPDFSFSV
jgi:hypothetical protein